MKIISNIFNAVSNNLISGGAYYQIAKGVLVTALITIVAWITATVLGGLVSFLMCYEKKVVSAIGRGICFVFRSVPVILTMWLFYYCIFGGSHLPGALIAGVAIGFWGGGYLSEIVARAVKNEQLKLSKSVKNKLESVYYTAVLPQALEDSMFELKRLAIHILSWTAVSGYITVNDLSEVMYGIGHRTMYPFFSIFFAAICYIIAALIIEWVFTLIKKHVNKEREDS